MLLNRSIKVMRMTQSLELGVGSLNTVFCSRLRGHITGEWTVAAATVEQILDLPAVLVQVGSRHGPVSERWCLIDDLTAGRHPHFAGVTIKSLLYRIAQSGEVISHIEYGGADTKGFAQAVHRMLSR